MYGNNSKVKVFQNALDDYGNDILHARLKFDVERKLKQFSLMLTTKTEYDARVVELEIVRFDCAHGHLHMHRFYRKPHTTEKIVMGISIETVQELIGQIRENCSVWKKAFMENYEVLK